MTVRKGWTLNKPTPSDIIPVLRITKNEVYLERTWPSIYSILLNHSIPQGGKGLVSVETLKKTNCVIYLPLHFFHCSQQLQTTHNMFFNLQYFRHFIYEHSDFYRSSFHAWKTLKALSSYSLTLVIYCVVHCLSKSFECLRWTLIK